MTSRAPGVEKRRPRLKRGVSLFLYIIRLPKLLERASANPGRLSGIRGNRSEKMKREGTYCGVRQEISGLRLFPGAIQGVDTRRSEIHTGSHAAGPGNGSFCEKSEKTTHDLPSDSESVTENCQSMEKGQSARHKTGDSARSVRLGCARDAKNRRPTRFPTRQRLPITPARVPHGCQRATPPHSEFAAV